MQSKICCGASMTCLPFRVASKLHQLREEHSIVKSLRTNLSGLHWSNETGLNIGLDEKSTWKIYSTVSNIILNYRVHFRCLSAVRPTQKQNHSRTRGSHSMIGWSRSCLPSQKALTHFGLRCKPSVSESMSRLHRAPL